MKKQILYMVCATALLAHKRPSLCWADIIPVCFQDGI